MMASFIGYVYKSCDYFRQDEREKHSLQVKVFQLEIFLQFNRRPIVVVVQQSSAECIAMFTLSMYGLTLPHKTSTDQQ